MADNFDMKKFLTENQIGPYAKTRINENVEEAKSLVSKEDKIQVIKEWIWFTCDEGQAKDDINKYNKMVDMYFASKDDVTKEDFKNIWNKVIEKWGVGDVGADSEGFYDAWKDIQTGTLVNPGQTYEGKEEKIEETVDNRTLMAVEKLQDMLANLKSNTATNSNLPTNDKLGLLDAFQEMEELLEDIGADIETEMDDAYVMNETANPEGDKLVKRFLDGIAKKFDYKVEDAARFVKETLKRLGY